MRIPMSALLLTFMLCTPAATAAPAGAAPSCAVNFAAPNIWNLYFPWQVLLDGFSDPSADWLAPTTVEPYGTGTYCAALAPGQKAVMLSSFELSSDEFLYVEASLDNRGKVAIIRVDGDRTETSLTLAESTYLRRFIGLEKGVYAVVIELIDEGMAAGALLSLTASDRTVVKNTKGDGSWQTFLLPAEAGPDELVQRYVETLR